MKTWGDVKVGDTLVNLYEGNENRESKVVNITESKTGKTVKVWVIDDTRDSEYVFSESRKTTKLSSDYMGLK